MADLFGEDFRLFDSVLGLFEALLEFLGSFLHVVILKLGLLVALGLALTLAGREATLTPSLGPPFQKTGSQETQRAKRPPPTAQRTVVRDFETPVNKTII